VRSSGSVSTPAGTDRLLPRAPTITSLSGSPPSCSSAAAPMPEVAPLITTTRDPGTASVEFPNDAPVFGWKTSEVLSAGDRRVR
jgi:hypothetical protein